jgi:uncharacterized membrane protein
MRRSRVQIPPSACPSHRHRPQLLETLYFINVLGKISAVLAKLRSTFVIGIFASAPLAITGYVFFILFSWFDGFFQPLVIKLLDTLGFYDKPVPGLGILLGILFVFIIGLLAPSLIGKQLLVIMERIVERLPLVKLIYSGTRQIFESFSGAQLSKFNRVVVVPFPSENSLTIGFVTSEVKGGLVAEKANHKVAVFVPTTPNPTSGYLIYVEPQKAISINMSVEDALKLVISGGLVQPKIVDRPDAK